MPLFKSDEQKLREAQAARAGQAYDGPACWCDDYSAVPRPGFYALDRETASQILAEYPLVCVDDAPGDDEDGSCHYEYAGPDDLPYRAGNIVSLEAHDAAGTSSTEV